MFKLLILLFIFIPIAEIMIFIRVGDEIGLGSTLFIVIVTAVIGVNLLKQQGFKSWNKIQTTMAQGQVPALEMAAAAQLLFAGGLLLTPGFLTDSIGFLLMVPQIRLFLAKRFISAGVTQVQSGSFSASSSFEEHQVFTADKQNIDGVPFERSERPGRTIEGEFEEKK